MPRPVCAIVGIGPGNGAALARRFAADHRIALLSRSVDFSTALAGEIGDAKAYPCDASDVASIELAFDHVVRDLGDVDTLVYNAGSGSWGTVEDITPAQFETSWRVNALGLLAASQRVIPAMKAKGSGNIVVIGATASRRGAARTTAFAPANGPSRRRLPVSRRNRPACRACPGGCAAGRRRRR